MTTGSATIVIVGLGPGNPATRTIGVQRALDQADRIILRTRIHPGLDDLRSDPRVTDCDDLYDTADGFDRLYEAISDRVLSAADEPGTIVFAVPGHPRIGERTVPFIEAGAVERGVPVVVMDAVSFIDVSANALKVDVLARGLQIADAVDIAATLEREPFAAGLLGIDPARPLLIAQVYNPDLAASVKIALSRNYPDEHPVTIVRASGVPDQEETRTVPLHLLDRQAVDHLTSVWITPLPELDAVRSPEALTRVVARLRGPAGCPWDRAQSHVTLRDSLLEEAYEVTDAIDSGNGTDLSEELGDLLLIVAMHAQLAEETGDFRIEDVYEGITRKLIRRHPHVFGDGVAETPDAVVVTWDGVKEAERQAKGAPLPPANVVDRLPRSMPISRKIIEILAPRTTLGAPQSAADGETALAAIHSLIDRGIDPERALESALRSQFADVTNREQAPAVSNAVTEQGGT